MDKKFKLIIGIDISKLTLDVTFFFNNESRYMQVSNDAKGIIELLKIITELDFEEHQVLICCENTGNYMSKLAHVLQGHQVVFWVVHPVIMNGYQPELIRGEDDQSASGRIAEFALTHQHKAHNYHHPDSKTNELKGLYLLRKQLVNTRQRVLNFKSSENDKAIPGTTNILVYEQLKAHLTALIDQVEKSIKLVIRSSEELKDIYKVITSVPGIGPVVASHSIAATDGFKKINNYKAFSCYIGTAPFSRSSGTSIRYRPKTSKKANQKLKAELHQGALSLIGKGRLFHEYYNKMIDIGKHHLWIMNTIMNILIKLMYTMLKRTELFNKEKFILSKKSWQNNLLLS